MLIMGVSSYTCGCISTARHLHKDDDLQAKYISKNIDKMIKKDQRALKKEVKLLLLGAGESGKTTFLKQMKIIHGLYFDERELSEYKITIYLNCVKGMKVLVDARHKLAIPWGNPHNDTFGCQIMKFEQSMSLDTKTFMSYVPCLQRLWADSAIKEAFKRRSEFQLADSLQYFMQELDRIGSQEYTPTNQDILYSRKATKGIHEFTIQINGNIPFRFTDVGGQRSQRQKWMQCFDKVTSVIFITSTSEFDQVIQEDRKTNRVEESRKIFDTVVNYPVFEQVSFIIFFNKMDLLAEKIKNSPHSFSDYNPEFSGDPRNLEDVKRYMLGSMVSVRQKNKKPLFHHFTTAVNTENITVVFSSVKDTILHKNLETLMLQ